VLFKCFGCVIFWEGNLPPFFYKPQQTKIKLSTRFLDFEVGAGYWMLIYHGFWTLYITNIG